METNMSSVTTLKSDEINKWREELCLLKDCRAALSGAELSQAYHAQRPHFQNYVDSVVQKYGAERVNIVLGCTVRNYDYDGRFDRSVKDWAQNLPRAPQPPRPRAGNSPPRDFHELVASAHPVILNFICKMRMEAEQTKQKPAKRKARGEDR